MLALKDNALPCVEFHKAVFSSKEFALFSQALKNDIVEAVFNTTCVSVRPA